MADDHNSTGHLGNTTALGNTLNRSGKLDKSSNLGETLGSTKGRRTAKDKGEKIEKVLAETTPLWRCLQDEDLAGIEEIISAKDADVNMKDSTFGWTPALFAANARPKDTVQMTKLLVEAKAKVEGQCNEGNTPLMIASRKDNKGALKFLLSKKANMDAQNSQGWTALIWASMNGHEECSTTLMAASADYNKADVEGRTACMWAARHGYLGIVEALLACGLNLSQQDEAGLTVMDHAQEQLEMRSVIAAMEEVNKAVVKAARNNDIQGVRQGIEAGAWLDMRDEEGWTPLMWAALHNSLDMVQLICRHGANPSLLDQHGRVVEVLAREHLAVGDALYTVIGSNDRLLQAAKDADWAAIELELTIGAWVNVKDEGLRNALHWAGRHGSADACGTLCNKNALLDERDAFGWTACHFAVAAGSLDTVSMLYYQGADFTLETFQGDSCLHIAARANDGCMMQLLLCGKAAIEGKDAEKFTSLQIAARSGLPIALRTLLAYSADVSVRDNRKRTPFHLAIISGHQHIIEMMMEPLKPPPKFPTEEEDDPKVKKKAKSKAKSKEAKDTKHDRDKSPLPKAKEDLGSTSKSLGSTTKSSKIQKAAAKGAAGKSLAATAPVPTAGVATRKKEAVVKREVKKIGDSPTHLLEAAIKKREAIGKTDKNPLGAKAALKQVDDKGKSSLALSVVYQRYDITQLLIREKADVEAADSNGNTILMEAVKTRQRDLVSQLLDMKVKVDKSNSAGKTAVDICQDAGIRMLLERVSIQAKVASEEVKDDDDFDEEDGSPKSFGATPSRGRRRSSDARPIWRVRLEQLPTQLTGDMLEEHIRALIRRLGAPNPSRVEVVLDPITARPRGWAYVDFHDAAAADLALRAHGEHMVGHVIKTARESGRNWR